MVEWHQQLNGCEFEQALEVGEGRGKLVCYSPWGLKESDMTESLNWTEVNNNFPSKEYASFNFIASVSIRSDFGAQKNNTRNDDVVQSLSHVQLFATPWTAARQASLSITNSQNLLKLMSIEWVMSSNHLIFSCPLLLPPSIFPGIRVFPSESVLRIRWPKYWSFSFSISPSNVYSGLIFFRIDWLDLLAVQGTLKSLLQHHRSKASIHLHIYV